MSSNELMAREVLAAVYDERGQRGVACILRGANHLNVHGPYGIAIRAMLAFAAEQVAQEREQFAENANCSTPPAEHLAVGDAGECSCAEIDGENPNCPVHELTIQKIAAWEDWECSTNELDGYTARTVAQKATGLIPYVAPPPPLAESAEVELRAMASLCCKLAQELPGGSWQRLRFCELERRLLALTSHPKPAEGMVLPAREDLARAVWDAQKCDGNPLVYDDFSDGDKRSYRKVADAVLLMISASNKDGG